MARNLVFRHERAPARRALASRGGTATRAALAATASLAMGAARTLTHPFQPGHQAAIAPGAALDPRAPEALVLPSVGPGTRRLRLFWQFAAIALCVRLALLPLGHPWDTVTFYNMFVEWGHGQSPYTSLRVLSDVARSAGWGTAYEGFAYPPGALYLYYPLARLFVLLHPHLVTHFPVEGRLALPRMPLDFYLWLKLPFWLGDLGIAWLLLRMTGTLRWSRNYLLNPYVLLVSGCWTFDSVMVFALLLAVYLLLRGRVGWSAAALAAGTMVKFVPAFVVPAVLLYLIARRAPLRRVALYAGVYAGVCLALAAPFLQGFLAVLGFEGARPGFGMHWEMILDVAQILPVGVDWHAINVAAGTFSLGVLVVALLLAYRYVFQRELALPRAVLVVLLVYLLANKLVNEQYVLAVLPFSYLELHAQRDRRTPWRWFHRLLWLTPLVFAAMNVPLDRFLLPLVHTVFGGAASLVTADGSTGLASPFLPWYREPFRWVSLDVLAVWFMLLVACALIWLARHPVAPRAAAAPVPAAATPESAESAGASGGAPPPRVPRVPRHEPEWKPAAGRIPNVRSPSGP